MKKALLAIIIFSGLVIFAQGDNDYKLTTYYYPLRIQVQDTIGIEIAYIDANNGNVIIRGNLEQGLKKLSEVIQGTFQAEAAARRIRAQLNATGTVKSRALLTAAIKTYDSTLAVYGR